MRRRASLKGLGLLPGAAAARHAVPTVSVVHLTLLQACGSTCTLCTFSGELRWVAGMPFVQKKSKQEQQAAQQEVTLLSAHTCTITWTHAVDRSAEARLEVV